MSTNPLLKELLEAGVHFGHKTKQWNPKMARFIFGEKNRIYIIDLEKTEQCLKQAQEFLRGIAAKGGEVLFIGTKRQAQEIIAAEAQRCQMPYVDKRWAGGILTNFQTIRKRIKRYQDLKKMNEDGTFERITKKERVLLNREKGKLEATLSGLIGLSRLPDALFVVDTAKENLSVKEANRLGIPIAALVDTNCDPDQVDFPVPGNDDAIRSIKLITALIAGSVLEGKNEFLAGQEAEALRKTKEESAQAEGAPAEAAVSKALDDETDSIVETISKVLPPETLVPKKAVKQRKRSKDGPKPEGAASNGGN